MDYSLFIILSLLIIGFGALAIFVNQKIRPLLEKNRNDQSMVMLQNQISEIISNGYLDGSSFYSAE